MLKYIIVACTFLVFSESALLNILPKCNFGDSECKKGLYRGIARSLAAGSRDMGIPPLDPVKISNITVSFPDSMELTLTDGLFEGMKECSFDYMNTNIDKQNTVLKITCDINFNGKYQVKGGQDSVDGEGDGKFLLDRVNIVIDFPFYVISRDGETYLNCKLDEIAHSYQHTGYIKFTSDDLGLGDKNEKIVSYLNENSNVIKEVFLPLGINMGLEFYKKFVDKFFSTVPTKSFINTDLTPYVKTVTK